MEIIFHIGMGKTGTSSIQKALSDNQENLRAQGVEYLGMWFDMIDPKFRGSTGHRDFMNSSPEQMEIHAQNLTVILKKISQENKVNRFIFSNEGIFGNFQNIVPFMKALKKILNVRLIAYARDPRDWLPSAFNQWAVYHKVNPGPISSYPDHARSLIGIYALLPRWNEVFADIFSLRHYIKTVNIVDDFASATGLKLNVSLERTLERLTVGESVLRAIYNNRFPEEVFPQKFDRAFRHLNFNESPNIDYYVNTIFDFSETEAIVSERIDLFLDIKRNLGINLLSDSASTQQKIDVEELRNRLLEHLLAIVVQQADRISNLETRISRMESRKDN